MYGAQYITGYCTNITVFEVVRLSLWYHTLSSIPKTCYPGYFTDLNKHDYNLNYNEVAGVENGSYSLFIMGCLGRA
jgi:hypothetical protein